MQIGTEVSILQLFDAKREIGLELIVVDVGYQVFTRDNRTTDAKTTGGQTLSR